MRHSPSGWFYIFAGLAVGCARMLEAAPVRFALLTDGPALADTMRFLRDAGCERRALATFESLASDRTAHPGLRLSHLPPARSGFYDFASVRDLSDALQTNGLSGGTSPDFNCFDTAFLLAGARLHTTLKPDDSGWPFLVWVCCDTNRGPTASWIKTAATPRAAFAAEYEMGRDYGRVSTIKFPDDMHDSRICLTAALFGVSVLPASALTNCSSGVVFPVLQASWLRSGVAFPSNFELLLVHLPEGLMLRTSHAGVLFPRGSEFTYIEKTGLEGDFIRLDLSEKADVFEWAWAMHSGTNTFCFATLNEKMIATLAGPPVTSAHATKPSRN